MSYRNYLDHEFYGRLWYEITISNQLRLGATAEENRIAGPVFELKLTRFMQCTAGKTPLDTLIRMKKLLDWYQRDGETLPAYPKRSFLRDFIYTCRVRRLSKKLVRQGLSNPVTSAD